MRSSYSSLPEKAGVYVYTDKQNNILYVGKANNLRSRVSSYFVKNANLGEKTRQLVSKVHKIKITIVESELEALLLESFYIKKYRPKYNIRLSDDKSYVQIRITVKDKYPVVQLARRGNDSNSIYFGPYPSSGSVKLVLKTIRKVFPFVSTPNHPKRICLFNHLGLCPCPPVFDSENLRVEYRKNIKGIIRILEGESKKIQKELEKIRDNYSKNELFEEALLYQKKINALSIITEPFHRPFEYDINPNLREDKRKNELTELRNILNANGMDIEKLDRIECYDISNTQGVYATGSMVVFIKGEKESGQYRKFKIKKDGSPNDFAMMEEVLTRRFKHDGWDRPDLVIVDGGKGQITSALKAFSVDNIFIPLIGLAKRDETIIIPQNPNIEYLPAMPTRQAGQNSKQIQTRGNTNTKHFENSDLEHSKIVSDFGIRTSNLNFTEVSLPKNSNALHLIMRIRDEAHRFAITYHRLLRSKFSFE